MDILDCLGKFGTSNEEICLNTLGITPEKINGTVILSPGWPPERLFATCEIKELVQASPLFGYQMWDIRQGDFFLTYIKTGFGARPPGKAGAVRQGVRFQDQERKRRRLRDAVQQRSGECGH